MADLEFIHVCYQPYTEVCYTVFWNTGLVGLMSWLASCLDTLGPSFGKGLQNIVIYHMGEWVKASLGLLIAVENHYFN